MTKQQLVTLILTFVTGLFTGVYLFVTYFAPQYVDDGVSEVNTQDITIIGEQIGGCQMLGICPSFRLDGDRDLSYIEAHGLNDDTPSPKTRKLSRAVYGDLQNMIEQADFEELGKPGSVCKAAADGVDYVYRVSLNGEEFKLDSCGTRFYGSDLYYELQKLWSEQVHSKAEDFDGVLSFFIDRFNAS